MALAANSTFRIPKVGIQYPELEPVVVGIVDST